MSTISANRYNPNFLISGIAGEALTAGYAVNLTAANTWSIADNGEAMGGIVVEAVAAAGDACSVAIGGIGPMIVDGSGTAIAAGDALKPDAGSVGKGIVTTTDRDKYGARALEAATTDGAIINVLILPYSERSTA